MNETELIEKQVRWNIFKAMSCVFEKLNIFLITLIMQIMKDIQMNMNTLSIWLKLMRN